MRRWVPWLLLILLWCVLVAQPRREREQPLPADVDQIDLRLGPKAWVQLQAAIARARRLRKRDAETDVWVKAEMIAAKRRYPCRIRLRGDNVNHWDDAKVSLRVKLRGEELYRGAREINLIVAHDRSYFLEIAGEWWNRRLGLLPCPSRMAWVRLNGEDLGAYALVEEIDKGLLEREGYPFAPLFKQSGEHFDGNRYDENRRMVYSRGFFRSTLKRAPNQAQVARVLEEVLRIYRTRPRMTEADLVRLSHWVDLDKLARFSALGRLLGSHSEHPHNAMLYFNSASGLFEPVFLDAEGLEQRTIAGFDSSIHLLVFTRELLTVGAWRDLRDEHLRTIARAVPEFARLYDGFGRWIDMLDRDPNLWLLGRGKQNPTRAELIEACTHYKGFYEETVGIINEVLSQTVRPFDPPPLPNQESRIVHAVPRQLEGGQTEVSLRHGLPTPLQLHAMTVTGAGAREVTLATPAAVVDAGLRRTWRWTEGLTLGAGADLTVTLQGFDPTQQRLSVEVKDAEGLVRSVVPPASSDAGVDVAHLDRAPSASLPTLARRGDNWVLPAGEHRIEGVVVVPRGGRLILEAGARLRFAPRASLLSYAPLTVAGTAERPVVCEPLDPARGWGLLGVLSTRAWSPGLTVARRSKVEHLVLRGARGGTFNGITYTGGLTFLSSDADVHRSRFIDAGGDDALNVKNGDVRVSECVFLNCPQDAIDLDWCSGTVERCLISACGGDGLDLSGAKAMTLSGNVILGAGDKAISVGEASKVLSQGNVLAGSPIGIASKDRSQTRSRGDVVADCQEAFVAYRKKPIFGGGALRAEQPRLLACGRPTRADARSRIEVVGPTVEASGLAIEDLRGRLRQDPRRTVQEVLRSLQLERLAVAWPWEPR